MLDVVVRGNIIDALIPQVIPDSLTSLQYAKDTILFMDPQPRYAKKHKWLLACFEKLSGMRINYNKCELVCINLEINVINILSQIFSVKLGISC